LLLWPAPSRDQGGLNLPLLVPGLHARRICGDNVNYWFGRTSRTESVQKPEFAIFKKEHLERTHAFFESTDRNTIILARFVPDSANVLPVRRGHGKDDVQAVSGLQRRRRGALGGLVHRPLGLVVRRIKFIEANIRWAIPLSF